MDIQHTVNNIVRLRPVLFFILCVSLLHSGAVSAEVTSLRAVSLPSNSQVVGELVQFRPQGNNLAGAEFQYRIKGPDDLNSKILRDWGEADWDWNTGGYLPGQYLIAIKARTIGSSVNFEDRAFKSFELVDNPHVSIELIGQPSLQMNPNLVTPLAGEISFKTSVPVVATLSFSDGVDSQVVMFSNYRTEHELPIIGLKPNSNYTVDVTLNSMEGSELQLTQLNAITPSLPLDFPVIEVLHSMPALMEPGYKILGRFGRGEGEPVGYMIIVNNKGEVVWYSKQGSNTPYQMSNGNLMFQNGLGVFEMDFLGNKRRLAVLTDPSLGFGINHEFIPSSDGNYLAITRELITIDGYPSSDTDPLEPALTADIEDNPVVEFTPQGDIVNIWRLTDLIDPTRIGYMSLGVATNYTGGYDWAHANSVFHDSRDDTLIVSVRHQDAVIKFSRSTGALKWILGTHANWKSEFTPYLLDPVGTPFEWQYHQHSAKLTTLGTILLFDNGNFRASPFDGTAPLLNRNNYSRAVEYEVDEETMEVRQVWEYGENADEKLFSFFVSEADLLPITGNVLITFGGIGVADGVSSAALGYGEKHVRLTEVTHTTPAEKVFDIRLYDPNATRTTVYRSENIKSFYLNQ